MRLLQKLGSDQMKRNKFIVIVLLVAVVRLSAFGTTRVDSLPILQDSLVRLGFQMYNNPAEPERLAANFTFVKTLVSALNRPHSFDFDFDSLDMVSLLTAPDGRLRVFSWHLPLNDGSYLYYGAVQLRTDDGTLSLFPLLDKTYEIEQPAEAILAHTDWYGAQYYRIIPFGSDYILLGWKGHTPEMSQKVIEILSVVDGRVVLGKRVFTDASTQNQARGIYRFSRQATMYLEYDEEGNRIVLDHLSPMEERFRGQYQYYGPDMSHDAWQLEDRTLRLVPDILLLNPPTNQDNQFNDPKKSSSHPQSGFP